MATILITGASSGLGAQMAWEYAALGHTLVLCARRQQRLNQLKTDITTTYPNARVEVYELDVTDADAVEVVFNRAHNDCGGLDRIIINAGSGEGAPIGVGNVGPNRRTVETNVLGTLFQAEAALRIFRQEGGGHVVFVSSFAGVRGMARSMAAYAASKAAVSTLAEGIRMEAIPGVHVTTLSPGFIDTDINAGAKKRPFLTEKAKGARLMVQAIDARKTHAYIPAWPWALLGRVFKILPVGALRRIM